MKIYHGKSLSFNIAIGKICTSDCFDDINPELSRFENSIDKTKIEINKAYEKCLEEFGNDEAFKFKIHNAIIDDEAFYLPIKKKIKEENKMCEFAIIEGTKELLEDFKKKSDSYLMEVADDVECICGMLINNLEKYNDNKILVCNKFEPKYICESLKAILVTSDRVFDDKDMLKKADIPIVFGFENNSIDEMVGKPAIVNGFTGTVYIEPNSEIISKIKDIYSWAI